MRIKTDKDGWITSIGSGLTDYNHEYDGEKDIEPADPSTSPEAWHWNDDNPELRETGVWDQVRKDRNDELRKSDWAALPDAPITDTEQSEIETYRQELRDLPQDYETPEQARDNWPDKPTVLE